MNSTKFPVSEVEVRIPVPPAMGPRAQEHRQQVFDERRRRFENGASQRVTADEMPEPQPVSLR